MAWTIKIFRPRDMLILPIGIVLLQVLASVFINRFMFHPIKGGYDKTLDGYVDIGTNGVSIAARIVGAHKAHKGEEEGLTPLVE